MASFHLTLSINNIISSSITISNIRLIIADLKQNASQVQAFSILFFFRCWQDKYSILHFRDIHNVKLIVTVDYA